LNPKKAASENKEELKKTPEKQQVILKRKQTNL